MKLSEKTTEAFRAHQVFCSAGSEWLASHDSKARLERPLIDAIQGSIRQDCLASLEEILEIFRDACNGEFDLSNLDMDDYWEQLDNLLG